MIKKTRVRIKNRNKSRDYIDGPSFQKHLLDWYNSRSNTDDIPLPIVTAVIQIINRLGTASRFNGYSYLEEMKGDATIACLLALQRKKYDPYKYDNPFAYFTQIAWNAFINVINKEHEQSYIKHASLSDHYQDMILMGNDVENMQSLESLDHDLIHKFENKKKTKPKKKRAVISKLDVFLEP